MKKFPPGSWELDQYDKFTEWQASIKATIPPMKTIHKILVLLLCLSFILTEINEPLQFKDEISDAEEDEEEEAPALPQHSQQSVLPSPSIRVSKKVEVMEEDNREDLVPNEPHISCVVFSYNLSDFCCL